MPDDTATDLSQTVAALRRELDTKTAERDEALAREAALAEVLQVINSSPGDLTPVFDVILEKAASLCGGSFGIFWRYDTELFHAAAVHGPAQFAEFLRDNPRPALPGADLGRLVEGEDVIHRADYAAGTFADAALNRAFVDLGGGRAGLLVALRKDGMLLGAIRIFRQEPQPFSDKQIALLQNFAAQAVIAMENARLVTETREGLEQQTATAEVLQVINSSPGDLTPVFEAVLDRATTLCDAAFGILWTCDGDRFYPVALHRTPPAFADFLRAHQLTGFAGTPGGGGPWRDARRQVLPAASQRRR